MNFIVVIISLTSVELVIRIFGRTFILVCPENPQLSVKLVPLYLNIFLINDNNVYTSFGK